MDNSEGCVNWLKKTRTVAIIREVTEEQRHCGSGYSDKKHLWFFVVMLSLTLKLSLVSQVSSLLLVLAGGLLLVSHVSSFEK